MVAARSDIQLVILDVVMSGLSGPPGWQLFDFSLQLRRAIRLLQEVSGVGVDPSIGQIFRRITRTEENACARESADYFLGQGGGAR